MDSALRPLCRLVHAGLALALLTGASPCPPAPDPAPRVAFFGSSTIYGLGASKPERRWTSLVCRYLGWQEINLGLPGSTVSDASPVPEIGPKLNMRQRWRREVLGAHPDRVLVMGGANDQFRRLPVGPGPGTFSDNLTEILAGLRDALGAGNVINLTPQPAPSYEKVRAPYDAAARRIADRLGLPLVDAEKAFPPGLTQTFSADGLHMNDMGHATMASFVANRLTELGYAPRVPAAGGGNPMPDRLAAAPAGRLWVEMASPLSCGVLQAVQAGWVGDGEAVIAVMRPDGAGGLTAIYRTEVLPVSRGIRVTPLPNWRVLDGDRLAVWSDDAVLGTEAESSGAARSLSLPLGVTHQVRSLKPGEGEPGTRLLAIRAWPR